MSLEVLKERYSEGARMNSKEEVYADIQKLLAVAEAAKNLPYGCWSGELEEALSALESK
jgi:hypothetical protein